MKASISNIITTTVNSRINTTERLTLYLNTILHLMSGPNIPRYSAMIVITIFQQLIS